MLFATSVPGVAGVRRARVARADQDARASVHGREVVGDGERAGCVPARDPVAVRSRDDVVDDRHSRHRRVDAVDEPAGSVERARSDVLDQVAVDAPRVVAVAVLSTADHDPGAAVADAGGDKAVHVVADDGIMAALDPDARRAVPASSRDLEAPEGHVVGANHHDRDRARRARGDRRPPAPIRHEAHAPGRGTAARDRQRPAVAAGRDVHRVARQHPPRRMPDRAPRARTGAGRAVTARR